MRDSDFALIESKLQRAEAEMRRKDHLLRAVADNTTDAVFVKDLNGHYLFVNEAGGRLVGKPADALLGRDDMAIFDTDSARKVMACDRRVIESGQVETQEEVLTAGGITRAYWVKKAPYRDERGKIIGVIGISREITDRKRTEEALRDRERMLCEAERVAHLGYWERDLQSNHISWSAEAYCILGLTPQEHRLDLAALGEMIHPDDRSASLAAIEHAVENCSHNDMEFRIVRPDGTVRTLQSHAKITRDASGKALRTFGTIQDITERKHMEVALRDSAKMLAEAQRVAKIGHWERDFKSERIIWSEEICHIFGMAPSSSTTLSPAQVIERIHPGDRASVLEAIDKARRGEARYDMEYRIVRPDGEIRHVHSQANVFRNDAGVPLRMFGIAQDITERKQMEEALRESENRYRLISQLTSDYVYSIRLDYPPPLDAFTSDSPPAYIGYTHEWVTQAFSAITGYTVNEVMTMGGWLRVILPEDVPGLREFSEQLLAGNPGMAEYRIRTKSGDVRWLRDFSHPVWDAAQGRVVRLYGAVQDISEKRRLEEQYRHAQKMEAIGQLAGGLAHDFNNLLTVIFGNSELLLLQLDPSDSKRELLSQIKRAGEHAASFTRQLLAFSRQAVMEPRVLNLNDVVRDNERMMRRLIGEDIQFSTVLDPALTHVEVDPVQMAQVIMNLMVNARDAMPQGGTITIRTQNVLFDDENGGLNMESGEYAMLAISDTGIGMSEATKAHIFEPFFTTKAPGKGTGLGLAVVHGIVNQSRGHIEVDSKLGGGTTIRIYLPHVRNSAPTKKATAGMAEPMPSGSETVLLAEDDETVRILAIHVLRSCGYTVLEASNGEEAAQLAESHGQRIDLLLSDVVMPKLGGRQLAQQLTAVRPGLKVLLSSGFADDAEMKKGVAEGEIPFLQKPFTPTALAQKVRDVLDR